MRAQQSQGSKEVKSARLNKLLSELQSGNRNALREFWLEVEKQGTPLVEPIPGDPAHVWTTFLWRARQPVRNVLLVSGLTNESYGRDVLSQNLMSPLAGTDIWYRTYRVRSDARFTYLLSIDDSLVPSENEQNPREREAKFRPDPLNPHHAAGDDSDSLVELPAAPVQDCWLPKSGSPKGEVTSLQIQSHLLNSERKIWIYTPAGYQSSGRPYRLLILMDGEFYTKEVPTPIILDNLLAAGKIPPTVAVFIGNLPANQPATRTTELSCHHPFTQFLVEELLPWIHERFNVTSLPIETVIAGASRGGTAAACAALEHQELFGNVASQSGFFVYKDRNWFKNANPGVAPDAESQEELAWDQYGWVMQRFASTPRVEIRFYLDVGKFENTFHPSPLIANRHLRDVLTAKGYKVKYQEFAGDHSFVNWRGTFPDALIYLLRGAGP
jgi:enterochelin esterase family protein